MAERSAMERFDSEKYKAEISSIVDPVVAFYAKLLASLGVPKEDVDEYAAKVAERGYQGLRKANNLAESFEPLRESFKELDVKD